MKKEPTYPNLCRMAQRGWTPSRHGEFLDAYNGTNMGGVTAAIATCQSHDGRYVVVEHR